ncbi:MAG: hypothetical protein AAGA68_04740 [Pseudomonadota bacterium]
MTAPPNRHHRGKLIFLGPDCTDSRVAKRIHAFADQGFEVIALTFRRQRYNRDLEPDWHNVDLGTIRDRAYLDRLLPLLRAVGRIRKTLRQSPDVRAVYAVNLDLLLLAIGAAVGRSAFPPIAYEVADIQPALTRNSLRSKCLRAMERWALKRVARLVVTSPRFIEAYFAPRHGFNGAWSLLENKLYPPVPAPTTAPVPHTRGADTGAPPTWTIGYFGAIRCERSMQMLQSLSDDAVARVCCRFHGYPTRLDAGQFSAQVQANARMHYGGEYAHPEDLPRLYEDIDFTWAFELVNEAHNSRWLLPNRLYEGGYYGRPLLAPRHFMIGEMVDALGIGWTFEPPYEEGLRTFFRSLTRQAYEAKRQRLAQLDPDRFLGVRQYAQLADRLAGGTGDEV